MLPCECFLLNREPDRLLIVVAVFQSVGGADLSTLAPVSTILSVEPFASNGDLLLNPGRAHFNIEVLLEAATHGLERTDLGAGKRILVDLLSTAARD